MYKAYIYHDLEKLVSAPKENILATELENVQEQINSLNMQLERIQDTEGFYFGATVSPTFAPTLKNSPYPTSVLSDGHTWIMSDEIGRWPIFGGYVHSITHSKKVYHGHDSIVSNY